MSINTFHTNLYRLALLTVILLILGDLVRKVSILFDWSFNRYSLISKVLILVGYFLFICGHSKEYIKNKQTFKVIILIAALITLFLFSNYFLSGTYLISFGNIEFLIRYLFFPITFLVFYNLFSKPILLKKVFDTYKVFFFINAVLIISGFLFELEIFKSYPNPDRFGYSGLMNRTNQISYITIVMILIYYFELVYLKKKSALILSFIVLSSLFIGTKKIYFFLVILLLYDCYIRREFYLKKGIYYILALAMSMLLLKNQIEIIFKKQFGIFIELYEKKGFVNSLLSNRNDLLTKSLKTHVGDSWEGINFFTGGSDFTIIRSEMDFVDIFLFFGIIGLIIYFVFLKSIFHSIDTSCNYTKMCFVLFLVISFFTSGFLISVSIPFIFFVGLFHLNGLNIEFNKTV